MFDYLQKFNSLPKELRDRISAPAVMAAVTELEDKYQVDLAMTVMKVMIRSLTVKELPVFFVSEAGLPQNAAENLTRELKERVFAVVADYLGLQSEMRALDLERDISGLIKEAGLSLASDNLVSRLKNILATYLRGVRNKIDTRNALAKDVKIGGLNLSAAEIDRLLKICDSGKLSAVSPVSAAASASAHPKPAVFALPPEEYDLKQALASGQVKPVVKPAPSQAQPSPLQPAVGLDTSHEISAPDRQLDLAAPTKPVAPVNLPIPPTVPSLSDKPTVAPSSPVVIQPTQTVQTVQPIKPEPVKKIELVHAPKNIQAITNIQVNTQSKVQTKAGSPVASRLAPLSATPPGTPGVPPQSSAAASPTIAAAAQAAAPARPTPARRPVVAPPSARPRMHDIRPVPKVMGPIEELQFLDPVNFRRLGQAPAEATAKIFAKIKLLEKDGYDKMIAGVRAWRQSPVNRLYLRIGQEAIAGGLLLKDAVSARQQAGQETLSMEEIEAVVKLNSKLVF
ncbi:MAG: hypothetical protein WC453_00510 [Patescibacteria group bacterium]